MLVEDGRVRIWLGNICIIARNKAQAFWPGFLIGFRRRDCIYAPVEEYLIFLPDALVGIAVH